MKLFKKLNLPILNVRDYLEARHDVWEYFFPQHYEDTEAPRETNPSAFRPLPGYVLDEEDVDQAQNYEEEQNDDEGGWFLDEGATGEGGAPEDPEFGQAFWDTVAMEASMEADRAKFDHVYNCPITDDSCDLCNKIYKEIDFDGNFNHTLGDCPGMDCEYCNREQEIARLFNEIPETSGAQGPQQFAGPSTNAWS